MTPFNFTIIASGLNPDDDKNFADRFYEAGCNDATISFQRGRIILEFEREARNFSHALLSAIADVRRAGAKVEHIEPDYLVSLTDIAVRAKVSRSATTLFGKTKRGKDFPSPVAKVATKSPLYDWVDVARWMFRRKRVSRQVVVQAKMVRETNRSINPVLKQTVVAKRLRSEIEKLPEHAPT